MSHWMRKGAVSVAGAILLAAGAAMLVLPGPGTLVILAGLAVLATEYEWAHRLLAQLRQRATDATRAVRERSHRARDRHMVRSADGDRRDTDHRQTQARLRVGPGPGRSRDPDQPVPRP